MLTNLKGVFMNKGLVSFFVLMIAVTAWASVRVIDNSGRQLGSQNDIKCGYGVDCAVVAGDLVLKPNLGSGSTFASGDATPSVAAGSFFKTYPNQPVVMTAFTGGTAGQEFVVLVQAAASMDVTGTVLKCGSTDLALSSGDLTRWIVDGTDYRCQSFIDASDNLN